jgi:hypothetical protein
VKEPWNFAQWQLSCISIFQLITSARHYTSNHPSPKANGGWEMVGGKNQSTEGSLTPRVEWSLTGTGSRGWEKGRYWSKRSNFQL